MKHSLFLSLLLSVMISTAFAETTPITQFGSNPWFSTELYPQDVLLRSGNYLFYSPNYLNKPYWGDIDEPDNKPNNTTDYTITGVDIVENGGSFKHSGIVNTLRNNFGYAYRLNENMMSSLDFDYNIDALRNTASGVFTTSDTIEFPNGASVPFDYSLSHTLYQFNVRGMFGTRVGSVPFGIKLEGGLENTLLLDKEISFSKPELDANGNATGPVITHSMSGDNAPAFNGWTTVPCNHIFDIPGPQGDSWNQSEYAIGPRYHLKVLGGASFDKVKAGGFFRYNWGHQNEFEWDPSGDTIGNDPKISENFYGSYNKTGRARIRSAGEGGIFGNIHWKQGDRYTLSTFVNVGYLDSTKGYAAAGNLRAEQDYKEKIHAVSLECDPNIMVNFGEFLNYIDAALLCRYRYARYNNTDQFWVTGGTLRSYNNSIAVAGWSDNWTGFSYANENVFDIGADLGAMFPLFSGGIHHLSLNLRLYGDVRFTYQRKYYGTNKENGSNLDFNLENTRLNMAREVMFNTFLMLHYVQGPYQLRLQFTKPVLYSIAPSTSIHNSSGKVVEDGSNYPLKKSALWITKEGLSVALFGSYDIILPFLRAR